MAGLINAVWVCLLVCCVASLSHGHMTMKSSTAIVHMATPRSPQHPFHLQVEAFNQKHQLTLNPAPSPFAANFKLHETTRDQQGRLVMQEVTDINNNLINMYHDPDTGAVVSVEGSSIEGLITPTLSIKPSTDGDHQVISQYPADHQYPADPSHISDYLEIPYNLHNNHKVSNTPRGVVSVKPELYIIIDSTLASALGSKSNIKKYLGIFYNAVNHRFATISDPKIQMVLAGALIVRNSADEPYINDNVLTGNYINGGKTLNSVSDWLYKNKNSLPAYDLAYLMTGKDMAKIVNGKVQKNLAGMAWIKGACYKSSYYKRSYNTGMGEDKGVFYHGVLTATHELAHNLGSPHDGKDGAEACSWDLGFIMSYVAKNSNRLLFSSCSKSLMKKYIQTPRAACLRSTSIGSKISLSSQLPGDILSLDKQCQKATGKNDAYASKRVSDDSLCVQLQCQWKQHVGKLIYTYTQAFGTPAAEGSHCRNGGVCTDGSCQ